jgi:hypothetical protein
LRTKKINKVANSNAQTTDNQLLANFKFLIFNYQFLCISGMREKPLPFNFSAAAAFSEDKCLDFTDCGLGIFCKSSGQILRG